IVALALDRQENATQALVKGLDHERQERVSSASSSSSDASAEQEGSAVVIVLK
ncbi:hypothetical protein BGZ94_005506, partial [Podila epigama]